MNDFNLQISESGTAEVEIVSLGKRYADFRIVKPRADAVMERSIRQYGQMQPVMCVTQGTGFELIDGFKRMRALKKLGQSTVLARIAQELPARVCKTLMVQLNRGSLSISGLEEALVIASLHREEKLQQTEIAVLFGRDKSWVSRRLALVEKLHEEIRTHILLGLLPQVCGRELSRLPRGNQEEALACVLRHRLTSRQTAKLAAYLVPRPRWEYAAILRSPWEVLEEDAPRTQGDLSVSLRAMHRSCRRVVENLAGAQACGSDLLHEALAAGEAAVEALKAHVTEGKI